jgi:hypothetical protein
MNNRDDHDATEPGYSETERRYRDAFQCYPIFIDARHRADALVRDSLEHAGIIKSLPAD